MMELYLKISALVCLLIGGISHAQDKQPTLAEEKAAFKKADAELNQVYQKVKGSLPEW